MSADLAGQLRSGTETCVGRTQRALAMAEQADCGAFVELFHEQALKDAEAADRELAAGVDHGPLHGIPIAVKDNIDVAGTWTRCGTTGWGQRFAEDDADVVARLREANAVVIGKTRLHELAWGMVTPGARNPHDPSRITGGSSGGAAAAVAAGVVPLALGTDTGGSVRNPAALCGVIGTKTAVGATSMNGIAPMAPTQDTVGVLTSNVDDCRAALATLGVARWETPYVRRVGRIVNRWAHRVEPEIAASVADAAEHLKATGVEVVDVEVQHSELAPAASYVIMLAEAARHWLPSEGQLPVDALGAEVRDQLRLGTQVTDADYTRALEVRAAIRAGLDEALGDVDALLLASSPVVANPIGEATTTCAGRKVPVATAHAAMTALASVAGLPALSLPGIPARGVLPTGVQLIGSDVNVLFRCADLIERALHPMNPAKTAKEATTRGTRAQNGHDR
jgi:aspartyl-tRNA(Asn)/glutamyl-tRNA(Gln) amidotransferase subunit A